jgi:hypothetical protein
VLFDNVEASFDAHVVQQADDAAEEFSAAVDVGVVDP